MLPFREKTIKIPNLFKNCFELSSVFLFMNLEIQRTYLIPMRRNPALELIHFNVFLSDMVIVSIWYGDHDLVIMSH